MKKIKVSLAAIAFVIAIGLSAFTAPTKHTEAWFTIQNASAPDQASSYLYYGGTSPCSADDHLCAIEGTRQASPNQNLPTQSSVDAAKLASNNFTEKVMGEVTFAAP